MAPRVVFLLADYGHDPTEVAIPWKHFIDAGFDVSCATEDGKQPACDEMMISGMTGKLLGANAAAKDAYASVVQTSSAFQKPQAWTAEGFNLDNYDLVFLPGGHEQSVRQIIDSPVVHRLLCSYFPKTRKPSRKSIAAICHGVQILAESELEDGKSILHDVETTALPSMFEQGIYHATKLFLGSYYKTYGPGTPSVQEFVTRKLDDPSQFHSSVLLTPFIIEDPKYNYISARFPPDAELLATKVTALVNEVTNSQ